MQSFIIYSDSLQQPCEKKKGMLSNLSTNEEMKLNKIT